MVSNNRHSCADNEPGSDRYPGRFTESMLLDFLREASALPGRGPSAMAIMLANQCRRLERHEHILVLPKTLGSYRLTSGTGYRALEQLQAAGLVKVYRRRGQGPTVTLLAGSAQRSDREENGNV